MRHIIEHDELKNSKTDMIHIGVGNNIIEQDMIKIVKPDKKYIYVHYRIDQLKLIRDGIIGLDTDHFDIDGYVEDAKSIIAGNFNVDKEEVIIMDYKYFGTELYFIDI